jgi:hypothetical protein
MNINFNECSKVGEIVIDDLISTTLWDLECHIRGFCENYPCDDEIFLYFPQGPINIVEIWQTKKSLKED